MARKVKCQITKEWGTSDEFVKIGGKYYKSQEIYDKVQFQKDCYVKLKDIIVYDLLEFEPEQKFPSFVTKSIDKLSFYSNEQKLRALLETYDKLKELLSKKSFKSDWQKSNYIFAVINNRLNDTYKAQKTHEKQLAKSKEKAENDDGECMAEALNFYEAQDSASPITKSRSIRCFLEEDD